MENKTFLINAWIRIANMINTDSVTDIKCPVCGNKTLNKKDSGYEKFEKFERHIFCTNCNASITLLMS